MTDFKRINEIRHEIIGIRQYFKYYCDLLENPNLILSHKKLREILHKCDSRCQELESLIFNGINIQEEK
jgi:hypothetical protein